MVSWRLDDEFLHLVDNWLPDFDIYSLYVDFNGDILFYDLRLTWFQMFNVFVWGGNIPSVGALNAESRNNYHTKQLNT